MKRQMLVLALLATSAIVHAKPSKAAIETCVQAKSTSSRLAYSPIPVDHFFETEDEGSRKTETTVRYGTDEVGTWETNPPGSFGLVYNGKQVPLDRVQRLSKEEPSQFNPYLAKWGVITEGPKSYICITFNFDGLGRSGTFQSVRGVYLIERAARELRPFYTVGRVTSAGTVLAK